MNRVSYVGPFEILGSLEQPFRPSLLLAGLVEMRADGHFIGVLTPGTVVGFDRVLMSNHDIEYYAVGQVILDDYVPGDPRIDLAWTLTVDHFIQWLQIGRMTSSDKFKAVISLVSGGKPLMITVTSLARVCGVSRPTAGKILAELLAEEWMTRDGNYFMVAPGS